MRDKNAKINTQPISNPKHQIWFLLATQTNLNVKQISTIPYQAIHLEEKKIKLPDRTIILTQPLYHSLVNYLKKYPNPTKYLFENKKNNLPTKPKTIYKCLERIKKKNHNLASSTNPSASTSSPYTIIGREKELYQLQELANKGCNILLLGPIGVGKSHLLKKVKLTNHKILRIDDFYDTKRTLIQCLLYFYQNDKKKLQKFLKAPYPIDKLEQYLQKDSIASLTKAMIQCTERQKYTIIIDHLDHLTPKTIKAIEHLKDHFTILTSAREIPITKTSFMWNFQVITIQNLAKKESIQLIHEQSKGISIKEPIVYQNHIYTQTQGNPRAILELIHRYKKEKHLSIHTIQSIQHNAPKKTYNLSSLIILSFTFLAALRYIANDIGHPKIKLIGGISLLILITCRHFFKTEKRKKL